MDTQSYFRALEVNIAGLFDSHLQQQFRAMLEKELEISVGRAVEAQLSARFGATCATDLTAEIANQVREQVEEKLSEEAEPYVPSYVGSLKVKATKLFRVFQNLFPEGVRLHLGFSQVLIAVVTLCLCVSDIRYVLFILLMQWWLSN